MGDKNIRKEPKKKKKSDSSVSVSSAALKPVIPQPEVIKKKKKDF